MFAQSPENGDSAKYDLDTSDAAAEAGVLDVGGSRTMYIEQRQGGI